MRALSINIGKGFEGLDLGKSKAEILSLLRSTVRDAPSIDEINSEIIVTELGAVLSFDRQERLRVIAAEHAESSLNGIKLIGRRLDQLLPELAVLNIKPSFWRSEESWHGPESALPQPSAEEAIDELLLQRGILWCRKERLGLKFQNGIVRTVYICSDDHTPETGCKQLTGEQLSLSCRPDLERYLLLYRTPRRFDAVTAVCSIALIAAFAFLAREAVELRQEWQSRKIEVQGRVSERRENPSNSTSRYTLVVGYQDPSTSKTYNKSFGVQDFYVTPDVGSELSLFYLPGKPEDARTQTTLDDLAFTEVGPKAIGALGIYAAVLYIWSWIKWLLRRKGRQAAARDA